MPVASAKNQSPQGPVRYLFVKGESSMEQDEVFSLAVSCFSS